MGEPIVIQDRISALEEENARLRAERDALVALVSGCGRNGCILSRPRGPAPNGPCCCTRNIREYNRTRATTTEEKKPSSATGGGET